METSSKTSESGFVAGFLKYLPVIQWALTIALGVGVFALSQRDLQATQAATVTDTKNRVQNIESYIEKRKEERDKQLADIKNEMLTKEVFDAYHKNDTERMKRIEDMVEKLLENRNRY